MRTLNLHALLGDDEPDASFHDARVKAIYFDAVSLSLKVEVLVPIYFVDNSPQYKAGSLLFTQVHLFVVEPQRSPFKSGGAVGLWLTSDGSTETLPPDRYSVPPLSEPLPDDAFFHYLYFSDTNSFIFVAASEASFSWSPLISERTKNAV